MSKPLTLVLVVVSFAWGGAAAAEFRAGAASVKITPPIGGLMGGYSARGIGLSTGVHDPLYAKALVLTDGEDTLAIVILDLVSFDGKPLDRVKAALRERLGIEQMMILVTHTHSGPTLNEKFPSAEKSWVSELEQKIEAVVKEAQEDAVPAVYGVGKGRLEEGHNRRKVAPDGSVTMLWRNEERAPTAPVDHEVGVIQVNTTGGEPIATLVNFACHPVILGPANLLISADYPGVMRTVVEDALGGVCLFANGACGDINPFMDKSDPADGAFEEVEKTGRALGDEAVRVVRAMTLRETPDADLTVQTEAVSFALRWDIENPEVLEALYAKYTKMVVTMILNELKANLPLEGDVVTVTLGRDLALVGLPGEFFVDHGLSLKAGSAIPNTFALGYCNGSLGYFPTINAAWEGGYGGKEATIVEVGAGERVINRALVSLYYQTGRLSEVPRF